MSDTDDCGGPVRDSAVLSELLADGSMVLYHTASRRLMTLNPTAALVWEHCDGTLTHGEIAAELREVFPGSATLDEDVAGILSELRGRHMLADRT